MFSTLSKISVNFSPTFDMLSANALNIIEPKFLSFNKGLAYLVVEGLGDKTNKSI